VKINEEVSFNWVEKLIIMRSLSTHGNTGESRDPQIGSNVDVMKSVDEGRCLRRRGAFTSCILNLLAAERPRILFALGDQDDDDVARSSLARN